MEYIYIFCFVLCICVITILALYIRRVIKQSKTDDEKELPGVSLTEIQTEFATVRVQAEVVELTCRVEMVGIKTPKAVTFFTVTFETDDKEIIRVDVPQEMYDGLEKGQQGELTLVEGELYSFII